MLARQRPLRRSQLGGRTLEDDAPTVVAGAGTEVDHPVGPRHHVIYGLTTSGGMIGLIVSMVGGVLAAVLGLLFGLTGGFPVLLGAGGALLVFIGELAYALLSIPREQARLVALFPAPPQSTLSESGTATE